MLFEKSAISLTSKPLKPLETLKQKISHLKTLYYLANADQVYTKVEAVYIKNVAERLGISPEQLENFDSAEPDLDLPDKEYKIYALFHRLVIIIMVDDAMHENEKRYCFNLGIKMGLHPNAIDEVIEYISTHGAMKALPQHIIAIFKKYAS